MSSQTDLYLFAYACETTSCSLYMDFELETHQFWEVKASIHNCLFVITPPGKIYWVVLYAFYLFFFFTPRDLI